MDYQDDHRIRDSDSLFCECLKILGVFLHAGLHSPGAVALSVLKFGIVSFSFWVSLSSTWGTVSVPVWAQLVNAASQTSETCCVGQCAPRRVERRLKAALRVTGSVGTFSGSRTLPSPLGQGTILVSVFSSSHYFCSRYLNNFQHAKNHSFLAPQLPMG